MATSTERDRLERVLRGQQALVDQVHQWLEEEQKQDDVLRAVVLSAKGEGVVRLRHLDPERIYDIRTIRALCVKYRLRFLDAGLFKGELPPQAVQAVRAMERQAGGPITSYRIMAPADRFRLCDSEADPLLFVPIGNDRYYLVHKWGNDLSPMRAVLGWPFRSPLNLAALVLAMAVLMALVVPSQWLRPGMVDAPYWTGTRVLFIGWSFLVLSAFTVFGWLAFFGQFSDRSWNSRYFNA